MFEADADLIDQLGGYAGAPSMGAVFSSATMGALAYAPDLSPVGSGSGGTYYPRDTSQDAAALNYLGFYPAGAFASHVGTRGSQAADMAAGTGAWDPDFQLAVGDFQQAMGLGTDGWIGPATRKALAQKVAEKNANGGNVSPIPIVPIVPPLPNVIPVPVPPSPSPSPSPNIQPAAASSSNTLLLAGVAGVVLLGGLAWALSD